MDQKVYKSRICDAQLRQALEVMGAVVIEGAKWCGKTSTAEHIARSVIYMQEPDKARMYQQMADAQPSLLLKGQTPRLIDEWQMVPVLWDAVRFEVDRRGEAGQFILTGSAVPADDVTAHTGTGRFARITMRPMSLYESGESSGRVSLAELFAGRHDIECASSLSLEQIAFVLCRGGFPATIGKPDKAALQMPIDYVEAVIQHDVSRVDGVEKNPHRVRLLLRSIARNIATMASLETIRADVEGSETMLAEKTLTTYYNALRRIFVVEDMSAWAPSLRSRTAIRTSSKRLFVDPSIAAAVMRISPEALLQDFEYFGFLFEALCARDVRVYAQRNDGEVFHYRDKTGLEADMIVQLRDGRWGAIEVKLGQKQIEEASTNLLKLREKVDTGKMREPSFLMVLTGSEYAYRRKDGVLVVPVGCLRE